MTGIRKFRAHYPGTSVGAPPAPHSHVEADVTSLVADLAGKQPLDSDLTTIAGLTPTTGNVIQSVAGAWASRTMAQLKVSLAIVVADISDFVSAVASAITAERTAVATLTNKTLTAPVINSPTGILKGDVGLGSVDNTADAAKNVLSATKLTTARTLNGTSFDGTANVTFDYRPGGTDVAITDGGTGVSTLPTGLLKGAGTGAITAAAAGTDYYAPAGTDVAITDGGTGVSTLPTGILKGAGTGAITAVTAPAGAVVGTTDSQALTNKDMTGAGNTFPSTLALDSAVVHKTGAETVAGVKTFSSAPVNTYQGSTPATPAAGNAAGPYFGADGLPYFVTPTGVVVPISIGEIGSALHSNPSFESWTAGNADNWSKFWQTGGTVAQETTDVLFGASSVTVSYTSVGSANQVLLSSVFTVAPGDTVDVGAWARKVTGAPQIQVGLMSGPSGTPDFFDGISTSQEPPADLLGATFARISKSFVVPSGHTVARLILRISPNVGAVAGSARLDFSTSVRRGSTNNILPGNSWPKEACRLATTAAFAPTTAAPNSVDGQTTAVGDRILKAVPAGSATDGIWTVVTVGTGANGVWARASDASTSAQVAGAEVPITSGASFGGSQWSTTFKATDTFGTTAMLWSKDLTEVGTATLDNKTMGTGSVGTSTFRDSVDARVVALQAAAVGAHRQMANSMFYTNQTTYAVATNGTERTALTTTLVKKAGFNLLVTIAGSGVLSTGAAQTIWIGIRINGTDYDVALNTPATGTRTAISGVRLITSLTASTGSWTCEPVFKADTATSSYSLFLGDDYVSYTIQQVP